ncbi:TRAP transporter permease [Maritimibacter alkaliphilus]|uniref:TRAP transporter permease n=1 Tax=Maritimibacter alkaliphilus TaxID=404236 RepID=UPI001C93C3D5|nr:TRAP transporter fused permease subunit [Maritimibacter alkaliphilus]MBY6092345.1 TRAP transporter fused permease subunit [Maritimibacter alkaliphilus]
MATLQDEQEFQQAQEIFERGRKPSLRLYTVVAGTAFGIALSVNQIFQLRIGGITLLEGQYLYLLAAAFFSLAFLVFDGGIRGAAGKATDWVLLVLSLAVCAYFIATSERSLNEGWEYAAPMHVRVISILFWALIVEATRRAGGLPLAIIVFLVSLYPTVASHFPGPLNGFQQPFLDTVAYHVISSESAFGIPMKSFGQLVVGFVLFGAVLAKTGGGQFFNDLAFALVGHFRGGAAKVAIFASGFMGSLSGSVISNVLSTGSVSIPAMKRSGFSAKTAAATEACASTGGVLMPPIMGATAFIMASFLGVPYAEVALAAAIPSLLFYFGLFMQIDAYAAGKGLKGIPRNELPKLGETLRKGWIYILVFALLIWMMIGLRAETRAPYFATALMVALNQLFPSSRLSLSGLRDLMWSVGASLAELTAVLMGVGLIVGAFSATGLAGTLVNDLVFLAGDSAVALLIMGAVTAFVFGMGMTVTACYVFLAVVLAPALEQTGIDRMAIHLFILYWGMVSFITPPVALGAFSAATLAKAKPFAVGVESMRLGAVIYIIPFFFVLDPALVGQGTATEVLLALAAAMAGIWLMASGFRGYVVGFGPLGDGPAAIFGRGLLLLGGFMVAIPGMGSLGLNHTETALIGAALVALPILLARSRRPLVAAE